MASFRGRTSKNAGAIRKIPSSIIRETGRNRAETGPDTFV
jgi:hypothetical protein